MRGVLLKGLLAGTMLVLVGCPRPLVSPPTTAAVGAYTLHGRIETGAVRSTQALMSEIANGATVSLIDTSTGDTRGTTLTQPDGSFQLVFGSNFQPGNTIYYLEAVKGLKVGDKPNRAGASAARIRTLVQFQTGGWVSLNSAVPGEGISITRGTTALSVLASLRADAVTPASLLGKLTVNAAETLAWTRTGTVPAGYAANTADSFSAAGTGLDPQDFHLVTGLVTEALAGDQDPLASVGYDRAANVFVRDAYTFSAFGIEPTAGVMGSTASVVGHNFDPNPYMTRVYFNGTPGNVTAVSPDRSRLTVTVPFGFAGTGPVTVRTSYFNYPLSMPFTVSVPPGASYQYYAFVPADADSRLRLIATQPNTVVTVYGLNTDGSVASTYAKSLAAPGDMDEFVPPALGQMYKVVSTQPIAASFDTVTPSHASDDDIATTVGTDYYLRQPAGSFTSTNEVLLISGSSANAVTLTCLQNPALNWSGTLARGGVYRVPVATNSAATLGNSYVFHVQSAAPTVATYGYNQDNDGTQIPSLQGDGLTFYSANRANGGGAGYFLVGYTDGTTATLTSMAGGSNTYSLGAGTFQFVPVAAGQVAYTASASSPIGFYFTDTGVGYDGTQHYSSDVPSGTGREYTIVAPAKATSSVYIVSSAGGNNVTLSGALSGTYSLGKDAWFSAGGLPDRAVLKIQATQPVAVYTMVGPTESAYTMLPVIVSGN